MAIAGINQMNQSYNRLSTMKKVNKAADDAAGLAIAEKLLSQVNGYDMANYNASASKNMLGVAEGGLTQIHDNLQRIRELSIQASNGIYTSEQKMAIQYEIDGLKSSIQDAAKGTEYNTMKLLDGSKADMHLALNPDGTGMKIQLANSTLDALGLTDYDVTKDFNIEDVDKAIAMISESRGSIGATQNVLDSVIRSNGIASENLTSARSGIMDLDVGKEVSELQKQRILNDYKNFTASARLQNDAMTVNKMLSM